MTQLRLHRKDLVERMTESSGFFQLPKSKVTDLPTKKPLDALVYILRSPLPVGQDRECAQRRKVALRLRVYPSSCDRWMGEIDMGTAWFVGRLLVCLRNPIIFRYLHWLSLTMSWKDWSEIPSIPDSFFSQIGKAGLVPTSPLDPTHTPSVTVRRTLRSRLPTIAKALGFVERYKDDGWSYDLFVAVPAWTQYVNLALLSSGCPEQEVVDNPIWGVLGDRLEARV